MPTLDDTLLMAFADGELDPPAAAKVTAHIAHDPDARDKVKKFRQSANLVRAVFDQHRLRPETPDINQRPQPGVKLSGWRRHSLMAASLAMFLLGSGTGAGLILARPNPIFADRLLDEVADYHLLYAGESEHQVEVPATRLVHIEAWLGDRLHRKPVVPDLSAQRLAFVGARLLSVDGVPVAQLLYQAPDREHQPLALCIAPDGSPDAAARSEAHAGLQEVTWSRSGYTYVLAGWETQEFLASLAAGLEPELQQSL